MSDTVRRLPCGLSRDAGAAIARTAYAQMTRTTP